jgi:hypothetical protein
MKALRFLWHQHRAALLVFTLALVAVVFFGTRVSMMWVYWSDPAHQDQPIAGWMTPGYIAQSYGVELDVIRAALALDADSPRRMPLEEIARRSGDDRAELVAAIEAAVAAVRASDQ